MRCIEQPESGSGRTKHLTTRATLLTNLLYEQELIEVIRTLRGEGIESIAFKGITLARRVYGSIEHRQMVDNDLLVRKRQVPRAVEALCRLGYRVKTPAGVTVTLRDGFQLSLARTDARGRRLLDLHWHPFDPALHPLAEETVWGHTELFELRGEAVRVFTADLCVLHLAAHFAQHHFREIRIAEDLARAWHQWRDVLSVAELSAMAREASLLDVLAYSLAVAHARFPDLVGPPTIESPAAHRLLRVLPPHALDAATHSPAQVYAQLTASLALTPAARWPRLLFRVAFPPLAQLSNIYARPPHPRLYLHYGSRPLRPVARLLGWRPRRSTPERA